MRKSTMIAVVAAAMTLTTATASSVSAVAVETGPDGEAVTVNDPGEAKGNPNDPDEGLNPAHGPSCGAFGGECAHNQAPADNGGIPARGAVDSNPFGLNLGAWNSYFVTRDTNSAICGIWATTDEIPDSEPDAADAFACDAP